MRQTSDILIAGAGIFGVTAALELTARGHTVTVLDPGPVPHPLAATTDISKVVRMEYGTDEDYMALVEQSLVGWRQWNEELPEPYYHETGVLMLARQPMQPGGFEHDSYQTLLKRGHKPERLDSAEIARRFPAWNADTYVDGFFHALGGFAESGRLLAALIEQARQRGVHFYTEQTTETILTENGRAVGVRTRQQDTFHAGQVLIAAGAWTPVLVPELASVMIITGHPIFHLRPARPEHYRPPHFVVFTADIARTGWYGFSLHPREGVVKIGNHGVGQRLHPEHDERLVTEVDIYNLRTMLADTFPGLADARITYTRRCLYCDTLDQNLWIDQHPEITGLAVASGGSGHAMKFAPMLGAITADAVEGKTNQWLPKFRWRTLDQSTETHDAARYND